MCIGAERAGTSRLYVNLKYHPEVWLPPVKEIRFFNARNRQTGRYYRRREILRQQLLLRFRDYAGGLRSGRLEFLEPENLRWDFRYFLKKRDLAWYESLFEGHPDKVKGDITPGYGVLPQESIALIHECNPQLRIIFLMRDQIERTWSAAMKSSRGRLAPTGGLTRVEFLDFASQPSQRKQNDYSRTLANWRQFFPEAQFFIGFTEDIEQAPRDLLMRLFGFIGVSPSERWISPEVDTKINTTQKYKSAIPADFESLLADQLYEPARDLAQQFEGRPRLWLERIEAAKKNPPPSP
jgi:hypothetical protein